METGVIMPENDFERDQSWYSFQRQATQAVRAGYAPEHISGYSDHFELQILKLPSFESTIGWQIYLRQPVVYRKHSPENEGLPKFIATRTRWAHQEDWQIFDSPVKRLEYLNRLSPRLHFGYQELEPIWIQDQLEKFHKLTLFPFVKDNSVGLDGVSYEINHGNSMAGARFGWWENGPPAWRSLIEIALPLFDQLELLYETQLAQHNERGNSE